MRSTQPAGGPQQGHAAEQAAHRQARRDRMEAAYEALEALLHELEGTQAGSPFSTREMAICASYLDTSWLWAREALKE